MYFHIVKIMRVDKTRMSPFICHFVVIRKNILSKMLTNSPPKIFNDNKQKTEFQELINCDKTWSRAWRVHDRGWWYFSQGGQRADLRKAVTLNEDLSVVAQAGTGWGGQGGSARVRPSEALGREWTGSDPKTVWNTDCRKTWRKAGDPVKEHLEGIWGSEQQNPTTQK